MESIPINETRLVTHTHTFYFILCTLVICTHAFILNQKSIAESKSEWLTLFTLTYWQWQYNVNVSILLCRIYYYGPLLGCAMIVGAEFELRPTVLQCVWHIYIYSVSMHLKLQKKHLSNERNQSQLRTVLVKWICEGTCVRTMTSTPSGTL